MTNLSNIQEAQIYVGTYAKYNAGSIFGKWLQLADYTDKEEFYLACQELHKDEQDPGFMFQDWENIPSDFIGESFISEAFFEILERIDEGSNIEAFETFLNWKSFNLERDDFDSILSDFEDCFNGEAKDEEDFAYDLVQECYNLDEPLASYFDYGRFARDLFMTDYYFDNGFVFRSC